MGNSLKVMLVDDEVTILEGFKRLFDWKAYGCEVVCEALDGVMAVNQAKLYQPDIIIMDMQQIHRKSVLHRQNMYLRKYGLGFLHRFQIMVRD